MAEMTHTAIDVGCEKGRVIELYVKEYLPMWMGDYKVTRLDIDPESKPDVLHDIMEPMPPELVGKFEYVHFTHVLEHMPWRKAVEVFKNVATLTAPGGLFMVAVPSMEFACRQIIRGEMDKGVLGMIYGGQDDKWAFHNSGFTKPALEYMVKLIGFDTYSYKETDIIVWLDGKDFRGKQHELMLRNPAESVTLEEPEPVVVTKRVRRRKPKDK
jgi:SAM-dependent methyltransferase